MLSGCAELGGSISPSSLLSLTGNSDAHADAPPDSDPQKAADRVLNLMSDQAATINGRFLWIEDGLQAPIPSWGEAVDVPPWR